MSNPPAVTGISELVLEVADLEASRRFYRDVRGPEETLHGVPRPTTEPGLMVCPTFRVNGELVQTIAMVARFDQASEITLDELRVELMYPFDESADRFFRHRATDNPGR